MSATDKLDITHRLHLSSPIYPCCGFVVDRVIKINQFIQSYQKYFIQNQDLYSLFATLVGTTHLWFITNIHRPDHTDRRYCINLNTTLCKRKLSLRAPKFVQKIKDSCNIFLHRLVYRDTLGMFIQKRCEKVSGWKRHAGESFIRESRENYI